MRSVLLAATALLALGVAPVAAGPEGASVVGGAATIQGQGGPAVIVNQSTPSAIINWNTFNIRANESVRFNQPGASSVALNRVVGGLGPSEIMGSLTANGRVFIINRDGILFGPGRYRRDPKRQQRRGGEQHAAHVRQAWHVTAKRLAGCRFARGAGVAEDFCRSCRSSNEIVARSKTRGQVLRACPAEN